MAKVTSFSSQELQEGGKKGKGGGQGRTRIAALLRMLEDEDVRVQVCGHGWMDRLIFICVCMCTRAIHAHTHVPPDQ